MPFSSPHLSASSLDVSKNAEASKDSQGAQQSLSEITETASNVQNELVQQVLKEDLLLLPRILKVQGSPNIAAVTATAPQGHVQPSVLLPLIEKAVEQKKALQTLQKKQPEKFADSSENDSEAFKIGISLNVAQAQLEQHEKSLGTNEVNSENIKHHSDWMQSYFVQHEQTSAKLATLLKTILNLPDGPKKLELLKKCIEQSLQIIGSKAEFIEKFYPYSKSYIRHLNPLLSEYNTKHAELTSKANISTGFSKLKEELATLARKLNPLTQEQKCVSAISLSCMRSMALLERSKSRQFLDPLVFLSSTNEDRTDLGNAFEQLIQALTLSQKLGQHFEEDPAVDLPLELSPQAPSLRSYKENVSDVKYFENALSENHLKKSILEKENHGLILIEDQFKKIFDYVGSPLQTSRNCIMLRMGLAGNRINAKDASRENLLRLTKRFDRAALAYGQIEKEIEQFAEYIEPDDSLTQAIEEAVQQVTACRSLMNQFSEVVKRFAFYHTPSVPESRLPAEEWRQKDLKSEANRVTIDQASSSVQQTATDFQDSETINDWLDSLSVENKTAAPVALETSKKKTDQTRQINQRIQTEAVIKAKAGVLPRIHPLVSSSTRALTLISQERDYFKRSIIAEEALENSSAAADIFFQLIQVCDKNPLFDKKVIDRQELQNGFRSCMKMASLFDAYLAGEKNHRPSLDMLEDAQPKENAEPELKLSIADDNRFITPFKNKIAQSGSKQEKIKEYLIEFRVDRPPVRGDGFGSKEYEIPHLPVWVHLHVPGNTDISAQGLRALANGEHGKVEAVTLKDELNRTRGATFTRRYEQPVDRVIVKEKIQGLQALKTLLSAYTDEQLANRLAQDESIEFIKPDSLAPQSKWTQVQR